MPLKTSSGRSNSLLPASGQGAGAKVVSASYGGGLIDYRVDVAPGRTLHVQAFPAKRFAVGDTVNLEVRPESYWLLGSTA